MHTNTDELGLTDLNCGVSAGTRLERPTGGRLTSFSPIDEQPIGDVLEATADDYERVVQTAQKQFLSWGMVPAPKRGEIIRQLAEELRKHKSRLARLISLEMGKILSEAEGEVQEAIPLR